MDTLRDLHYSAVNTAKQLYLPFILGLESNNVAHVICPIATFSDEWDFTY